MWLWLAFGFLLFIQLGFYLLIFSKYAFYRDAKKHSTRIKSDLQPWVSIVICAKNEASHLSHDLEAIASQVYPNFEIILVDDGSEDETPIIMEAFKRKYAESDFSIELITIAKEDSNGKKRALSIGIERALHEILLLTDADCKPESPYWIDLMLQAFEAKTELVLGYGPYAKQEGSFLNKIIRYETLLTAIQYFSYALKGTPYMGVGRNMAYRKSLFIEHKGFEDHLSLRSGDDDLFVHKIAHDQNTSICDHPDSFMISEPKTNLKSWIDQKRRHISTASHYKTKLKGMLGLFYISQLGFYVLGTILLFTNPYWQITGTLIALRFLATSVIISRSAKKLNEKDLISLAPLFEISIIFMQLYIFIVNKFSPPKHW